MAQQTYTPTQWQSGDAITRDRMLKIEEGIQDAHSRLNDVPTNSELNTQVQNLNGRIDGVNQTATDASSLATTANNATVAGTKAWDQLLGVITTDEHGEVTTSLGDIVDGMDSRITTNEEDISKHNTVLRDAAGGERFYPNPSVDKSVGERLDDMYRKVDINDTTLTTINNNYAAAAGSFANLTSRLNALDGNPQPQGGNTIIGVGADSYPSEGRMTRLENEVNATHENGNTSLKARFVANETAIGNLQSGKLNADSTGIIDDLLHTDVNKALSANQGNVIKNMLGTGVGTAAGTTVVELISAAEQNAKNYADEHKVDKVNDVYNNTDRTTAGKVLDARVGNTLATRINALDSTTVGSEGRVTLVENEITEAHRNGVANDTLDNRFDDIETNITTIANELGMVESGAIVDTNTKVDRLNDNVLALGKEIGMLTEETTLLPLADAINRSSTDIDKIKGEIADAHRPGVSNDTLDKRFDNIDYLISHSTTQGDDTTGLTEHIAAAEYKISHIKDVNDENDKGGLEQRVNTIEGQVGDMPSASNISEAISKVDTLETALGTTNTNIDKLKTDLGIVEDTDTATHNILEGNYIIWKGNLYKATTDILNGTTLSNINLIAVNNGGFNELNSIINTGVGEVASSVSNLAGRVTTLENEPKSATVVIDKTCITYDSQTNVPTIYTDNTKTTAITPTQDADYLLQNSDNKYYYWKYIGISPNGAWELISGGASSGGNGGGTGNSNSENYASYELFAAAEKELNKDYYVLQSDGYHHYRYLETTVATEPIEIGNLIVQDNIKRYNIAKREVTVPVSGSDQTVKVNYLDLYEYDYGVSNANTDTLPQNARRLTSIELPEGGGSGAGISLTPTFIRITPANFQTVKNENKIYLRFFYAAKDITQDLVSASYILRKGNVVVKSVSTLNSGDPNTTVNGWPTGSTIPAGYEQIDVTDYCELGDNIFEISLTANGQTFTRQWTINIVELRLASDAPLTAVIPVGDTVTFEYTPFGGLDKTLYVKIDGTTYDTVYLSSSISGDVEQYIIPSQAHGAHTISFYMEAQINGQTVSTEPLVRKYLWYNEIDTNAAPIVIAALPILNSEGKIEIGQYSTLTIPYIVYNKNHNTFNAEYYFDYNPSDANQEPFDTVSVTRNTQTELVYTPTIYDRQDHTLTIKIEDVVETFILDIQDIGINVAPFTGEVIDFDPSTLTNSSSGREPTWTYNNQTYHMTVSDNFNWSTNVEDSGGGYREDEDGKCFIIKAGTYIDIDYKMFKQNNSGGTTTNSVFDNGQEMKIIFKTKAVRDASAIWFTNMGRFSNNNTKEVGIQLSAHEGFLKTDKATSASKEYVAWKAGKAYAVDDEVKYDNDIFKCIEAIIANSEASNIKPEINTTNWEKIYDSEYHDWISGNTYAVNDLVIYKNIIYKCIKAVTDDPETDSNETEIDPKSASENWVAMGQIDINTSATNSYLYFPYSEEDKIELDININKQGTGENFIMSYEDGVPSKAYAYDPKSGGDILYHVQNQESTIRIGSPDCDVYIYRLRIYDKSLTTANILKNFIADGKDITAKLDRYWRNAIYYDATKTELPENERYTPYATSSAKLDPIKLSKIIPDVKILMLEAPQFTTGKKDFIKNSTLRCIQAQGGKIYPATDKDNWFFYNGYHAGQGTTSDNYGQAGRNVDFLFECDGTHYPTKKKNMTDFTKGYKSGLVVGDNASVFDNNSWRVNDDPNVEVVEDLCTDWMDDSCRISLTHDEKTGADTSIPNNYFNLKVNIASSENVNNALFQKRYNDFLPRVYESPAYLRDNRIKNDMEFVPAILFIRETGPIESHKEFKDTDWHFYALGNIGDSKKSDYTRAYNPKDMNEFTVEVSDNNTSNSQFQSGVIIVENERLIETDMYPTWSNTVAYHQGDRVGKAIGDIGRIFERIGADQTLPTVPEGQTPTLSWIDEEWQVVPGYVDMNTSTIDPMSYVYPITAEEWDTTYTKTVSGKIETHYVNYRHETLVNEEFDGDHSFEFRYGCCGDYRDGDSINDIHGNSIVPNTDSKTNKDKPFLTNDDVQFNTNKSIIYNFYRWIVTSSNDDFHNDASNWFVPEAIEFFYAFTHYYTMMDNRAKNTFWHWGKRYISTNDANGTNYEIAAAAAAALEQPAQDAEDNLTAVKAVQNPIIDEAQTALTNAEAVLNGDPENADALAAKSQAESTIADAQALINEATTARDLAVAQLTIKILKRDELKFLYDNADCYTVNDTEAAINEGRRFDLWVYDCDTAAGIDNNGELIFPYGKEDEDYRVGDDPGSGWAFNGSGSIFWRRLSRTFTSEINTLMNSLPTDCFSDAQHLINQFDQFQSCFPEEIWRKDIERKYIRTFTGNSVDNSVEIGKQNIRFLKAMMQGRKKYQRRQWIRDQAIYFGSKYFLSNVRTNDHIIEFVTYTPTVAEGETLAVPVDTKHLKIVPYQDMYVRAAVGNSTTNIIEQNYALRAKAGEEVIIDCSSGSTSQETRVYIYAAEYIAALDNLAPMYIYSGSFGNAKRLKKLIIGSDNPLYNNSRFTQFSINDEMPILEELNIKYCTSLTDTINLGRSNNVRRVEAEGSSIGGVTLPNYSSIQTLHLPNTVTGITLKGARNLSDFYIKNRLTGEEDYTRLNILDVEDSDYSANINWLSIAGAMVNNADKIILTNLRTSTIDDIVDLDPLVTLKRQLETNYDNDGNLIVKVLLSGVVTILGTWSTVEKDEYSGLPTSIWPDLTLIPGLSAVEEIKYYVLYKYPDDVNNGAEIYHKYVSENDNAFTDICVQEPRLSYPTKPRTAQYTFNFGTVQLGSYQVYSGWKRAVIGNTQTIRQEYLNNGPVLITYGSATNPFTVEAVFTPVEREYPVRWYLKRNNDGTPDISTFVEEKGPVPYGGGENLEAPTVDQIRSKSLKTYKVTPVVEDGVSKLSYEIFKGWEKLPTNINPTADDDYYNIYGVYETGKDTAVNLLTPLTYSPAQLAVLSYLNSSDRATLQSSNKMDINDRFTVNMGYEGSKPGTLIIGPGATERLREDITGLDVIRQTAIFDGQGLSDLRYPLQSSIQPLMEGNDAFTMVIDYAFDTTASYAANSEATLMACYSENNGSKQGFKLYYDTNDNVPRFGYGDTLTNKTTQSIILGSKETARTRNTLVIRHPAGSNILYLYSNNYVKVEGTTPIESFIMDCHNDNNIVQTLSWGASSMNTDAKLTFGKLSFVSGLMSGSQLKAAGTIYYAKYWNEDLGVGECKQLAAWNHEQMTFGLVDFDGMDTSRVSIPSTLDSSITKPNLVFTALTSSSYRSYIVPKEPKSSHPTYGWENSEIRQIANNRIFNGLPVLLQSVIAVFPTQTKDAVWDGTGYNPRYMVSGGVKTVYDYIFFPSYIEVGGATNGDYSVYIQEANRAFDWVDSSNVSVYNYNSASHNWSPVNAAANKNYMNLRFPYLALAGNTSNNSNRIFCSYNGDDSLINNSYPYNTIEKAITNGQINTGNAQLSTGGAKRGDIYIDSNNNAYIYVLTEDLNSGVSFYNNVVDSKLDCNSGAWVPVKPWYTRSAMTASSATTNFFIFVNGVGTPQNNVNLTTTNGYNFSYSFGV